MLGLRMEPVLKKGPERIRSSDIPKVIAEDQYDQSWRMALTMGLLALVSIMFLTALNAHDYKKFYNMDLDPNELTMSYRDEDAGVEDKVKSYVMGKTIYVTSPLDDLDIQYIIPRYSSQLDVSDKEAGYYGNIGDSYNNLEPLLTIHQGNGQGSMFSIDLVDEQPINMIAIMGSYKQVDYTKLDTAKVYIRDKEGKKVWQSSHFLKPQQFNYVKVSMD